MTGKILRIIYALLGLTAAACAYSRNEDAARPTSEAFKKSSIYQILLPLFTQEGTLKSAEEMLEHVKSTGVDIVYLCPIAEADDGANPEFWSKRQKASKTGNPKNPYRIKDYYKVDPMFGSDADLKSFVDKAHSLGLKVILDLVYYHCGPNAKIISMDKNNVVCDKNGNIKKGRWSFPELNFANPKLREYMLKNMEYFVEKFDVDGYRTDVEAFVPPDFWVEGYKRIKKIKPDVIMVAESRRPESQLEVYDASYSWTWSKTFWKAIKDGESAKILRDLWTRENEKMPRGARLLRALDNHDTASDVPNQVSHEKAFGFRAMNAIFVFNFTIDGIPFIYNGNEIANDSYMCMFSTKEHGRYFIAWENALGKKGKERLDLIKTLTGMRKANPALYDGETLWIDTDKPDSVLAYARECPSQKIRVAINMRDAETEVSLPYSDADAKALLEYGVKFSRDGQNLKLSMKPFGYIVLQGK